MKTILLLGLCLLTESAGAQSVYKCRDTAGAVVYQSAACDGAAEKHWTADPSLAAGAGASNARTAAERSIEHDRQYLKASNRATTARNSRRTVTRARGNTPNPCERERRARAAAHERRGVHWSYTDASYWDGRVFKVCR